MMRCKRYRMPQRIFIGSLCAALTVASIPMSVWAAGSADSQVASTGCDQPEILTAALEEEAAAETTAVEHRTSTSINTPVASETEESESASSETPVVINRTVVELYSVEDLITLAQNCTTDTWSDDKRVQLKADLNLNGTEFRSIPIFNGIFEGGGHTISGYNSNGDGYISGLFRYLGTDAVVEDLTVAGLIVAANDQKCIGGICGMNYGIIRNCSFRGSLSGKTSTGGICGINESTGLISNCSNAAHMSGYYYTGGIAGKNYGIIQSCSNTGNVNDSDEWITQDDAMQVDWLETDLTDVRITSGVDTGGIAGYSKGSIIRCENDGTIGYAHAGYNIGGIAGRQSGVLSFSTNRGDIYGRKDIGGIVGQTEPYVESDGSRNLPEAVDLLHDLIDQTLTDVQNNAQTISTDMSRLTNLADGARESGYALGDTLSDYLESNTQTLNLAIDRMDYVSDSLPDIMDQMEIVITRLTYASNNLASLAADIDLQNRISSSDKAQIEAQRTTMNDALTEASASNTEIQTVLTAMEAIIYDANGNPKSSYTSAEQNELYADFQQLIVLMADSGTQMATAMSAATQIAQIYEPYIKDASSKAATDLGNMSSNLQTAQAAMAKAEQLSRSVVDYLNAQADLKITEVGSDWDTNLDSLNHNLKEMTNVLEDLNRDALDGTTQLTDDLSLVNDQLNVVFHMMSDTYSMIKGDDAKVFTDVSDREIEAARTGRVDSSTNKGNVRGDINVGGIAGSMAFDEDDPEENAAGSVSISNGSNYTLQNIICDCASDCLVQAKKEGAGGIVGYMAHGIVSASYSTGAVQSLEGDYVGGIAGESRAIIRGSYAMCLLRGAQEVGGIAGFATTIVDCGAIPTWESIPDAKYGAIAGDINHDEDTLESQFCNIYDNYYVCDSVKGIDNIDYEEIAEAVTYQQMVTKPDIPKIFRHPQVIFVMDEEKVGAEEVAFGEKLDNLTMPDVLSQEGTFVAWPDTSDMVMNGCVVLLGSYATTVKTLQSEDIDMGSGKVLAFLDGTYTDTAQMAAQLEDLSAYDMTGVTGDEMYAIRVTLSGTESLIPCNVRLYNRYEEAEVYLWTGSSWEKVPSLLRGSYLQTQFTGTEETYLIVASRDHKMLCLACAAGVAVLLIVILFIRSRRKRKGQPKAKE